MTILDFTINPVGDQGDPQRGTGPLLKVRLRAASRRNIFRRKCPRLCGCDGTGRHARFRFLCREAYGFKSLHPHHVSVLIGFEYLVTTLVSFILLFPLWSSYVVSINIQIVLNCSRLSAYFISRLLNKNIPIPKEPIK